MRSLSSPNNDNSRRELKLRQISLLALLRWGPNNDNSRRELKLDLL